MLYKTLTARLVEYPDLTFTDSHCHLDFPALSANIDNTLARCLQANVKQIIIPSIGVDNWQTVADLCQSSQTVNCYYALGIHPWYADKHTQGHMEQLCQLASSADKRLIAIGETGLDGNKGNMDWQISLFQQQIALAKTLALPLIVHHYKCHAQVLSILKQTHLPQAGVIHAFSGSYQQAKAYIDLGFKLGIGGTITYERAKKTRRAISQLNPVDLLLETDAPSMPLARRQGQPNHPALVTEVFGELQQLLAIPPDLLAKQLEANVQQLFFNR